MKNLKILLALFALLSTLSLHAKKTKTNADWSKKTHSNQVDPNYDEVFDSDYVRRIDITIQSSNWEALWAELEANLGFGNRQMGGNPTNVTGDFSSSWVPCTISSNSISWNQVGLRFKGNSSLMRAYQQGNKKLSMKLDFDEYEDDFPELKNQRFYGFKQLNLNSNFDDQSFLHEKVAADLLREFGLPAAHTSFCEIYIDYGSGAQYYGLYTIVEEVDDTLLKDYFSKGSGNIYKPEERAGSFAEGSFEPSEFYLKNGDESADYSDVKALYDILHSDLRTSNSAEWMSQLESVFDVEAFLRWLAANTAIQNWDTYGNMAHNYYLYNNPNTGKLTWISWDHNEALRGGRNSYEPDQLHLAGESWPLITYIIATDKYRTQFDSYLAEFIDNIFTPAKMVATYDNYYALLKESVYKELSLRSYLRYYKEFDQNIETLKAQVSSRQELMKSYLE